jgi:hypothetical protein
MSKPVSLKDLMAVDYTDGSYPEDIDGIIAKQYKKRHVSEDETLDSVDESLYDTMSKHELHAELARIDSHIRLLKKIESGGNVPKSNFNRHKSTLANLEFQRKGILGMLKEDSSENLDEALTIMQRMKRRSIMRRNKGKIAAGRRRSQRRRATSTVLQSRAMRAARNAIVKKLLRKSKGDASYAEKVRAEKFLASRTAAVTRLARKLLPQIRAKEKLKFAPKPTADTKS